MGKAIYRREEEVWDIGRLLRRGLVAVYLPAVLILGLAYVLIRAVFGNGVTWTLLFPGFSFILFCVVVFAYVAYRWTFIRGAGTVALFAFISVALFWLAGAAIFMQHRPKFSGWVWFEVTAGVANGAFCSGLVTIGWVLFRMACRWLGYHVELPVDPLCSHCGYDLRGNVSMVCPECGRQFTFAELGVTAEAFRELGERVE